MLNQINWIDIVILILLIRTGYVGLSRGITSYFFSFLGLFIAALLSIHYYGRVAELLMSNVGFLAPRAATLISFIILVGGVILFFKVIVFVVSHLMKIEFASFLEKTGGLILGIVYGFLFSSLLLIIFSFSEAGYVRQSLENSYTAPFIIQIAPRTYDAVLKNFPIMPAQGRADIPLDIER